MPVVEVKLLEGRSDDQKARIAQEITKIMVEIGGAKTENVTVNFQDFKKTDYAVGGVMMSEKLK